jgi:hypothetical protein
MWELLPFEVEPITVGAENLGANALSPVGVAAQKNGTKQVEWGMVRTRLQ